jgi:hypothetical protein
VIQLRQKAHEMRTRVDNGDLLDMDEVAAAAVTLTEAVTVFSDAAEETAEAFFPRCCGERCECSGGLFGGRATCKVCGAEIRNLLAPLDSPILRRGNSFLTTPGAELIAELGERQWLVTHEGDRP